MGSFCKCDIKGGQMTFGERIALGRIISGGQIEVEQFKACMAVMCPGHKVKFTQEEMAYWHEILVGIKYWVHREQKELKYNPTAEEVAAGIDQLTMKVGEMSTITALAEKFAKDPDEILLWKYGKIFNILYNNLQSYLYKVNLDKVIKQKQELKTAQLRAKKGRK